MKARRCEARPTAGGFGSCLRARLAFVGVLGCTPPEGDAVRDDPSETAAVAESGDRETDVSGMDTDSDADEARGVLHGVVLTSQLRGRPNPGLSVRAFRAGVEVEADRAGRFRMELPLGPEWLFVSGPGYMRWGTPVVVGEDPFVALVTEPGELIALTAGIYGETFEQDDGLVIVAFDLPSVSGGESASIDRPYGFPLAGYQVGRRHTVRETTIPPREDFPEEELDEAFVSFWNTEAGMARIAAADDDGSPCLAKAEGLEDVPVLPFSVTWILVRCAGGTP